MINLWKDIIVDIYRFFVLLDLLFLSLVIIEVTEEQSNEEIFDWNDGKDCKKEEPIERRGSEIWIENLFEDRIVS